MIKTLGDSLKTFRVQVSGLTAEEFAKRIEVSRATLYRMENGDPRVAIGYWERAMKYMQVDRAVANASRNDTLLLAAAFKDAESRISEVDFNKTP